MPETTSVLDEESLTEQPVTAGAQTRAIQRSEILLIGSLILISLLCYGNTLVNGFVYDDEPQILQNPYVKSWHFLPEIFTTTVWSFVGQAGTTNYYRPLMTLSFLLLWKTFGPIPFGFHLFNIAMHAAVVVMVFYAGMRIFADRRVAWCGAALFAVHPIHTEVVNWIAALPDLEATFLFLLAFWLFAKPDPPTWRRQLGVCCAFLAALLAKEPSLMLVPLALAFEHGVRRGRESTPLAAKIARYAPLCAVGVSYVLLRMLLFGNAVPVLQHPKITWPVAIYSAFSLLVTYAKLLVWPWPLSAFHVFHASSALGEPSVLGGVFIVIAVIAAIVALRKTAPAAAFALLWMGVTLGPVLNARWMAANVLTERYLYLPSVGFCWLVAFAGVRLWDARPAVAHGLSPKRVALATALSLVLVAGCVATVRRNRDWESNLSLYTRTLETNPDAAIIRSNRASVFLDQGDLARAEREWKLALEGKPDNVVTMNSLGLLYNLQKRYGEAEEILLRAIAIRPNWGVAHYQYGITLESTGRKDQAMTEFQKAIEVSPLNAAARLAYANALMQDQRFSEAEIQFKKAAELQASDEALSGLATLYLKTGQREQAATTMRLLLKAAPFDGDAHLKLAQLLEASGQTAEAVAEYQAVLATDPANTEAKSALLRLKK